MQLVEGSVFLLSLPVINAVCSSPQAIFRGVSFFSQNLLGMLSANLLFPKVKTAPDSETPYKTGLHLARLKTSCCLVYMVANVWFVIMETGIQ